MAVVGGYGLYILKGKPVFLWNLRHFSKRVRWEGKEPLGKHRLEYDFKYDGWLRDARLQQH